MKQGSQIITQFIKIFQYWLNFKCLFIKIFVLCLRGIVSKKSAVANKKKKNRTWYFFYFRTPWTHENCILNPIISKFTHHTINMKIYSKRAKLGLYKDVLFYLKSLYIVLINYVKGVVSWVHLSWKIECKSIRIQKHTHFIFSLESLAISI